MHNVLIISLHYPPDNIIAARRSEAYAKHLYKFGIYPTILTDRFEKVFDENGKWIDLIRHTRTDEPLIEEFPTHRVIRLPRVITAWQKIANKISRIPLIASGFNQIMHWKGHLEIHLIGHYLNYKRFLLKHLNTQSYDLILAIDSPHYHVRLASEMHKVYNIPFICDFRDLFDNDALNNDTRIPVFRRFLNFSKLYHLKKWIKKGKAVTSASAVYAEFYGKMAGLPFFEITNGFDPSVYANKPSPSKEKFSLAHVGQIYDNQNWDVFFQGLLKFLDRKPDARLEVMFVGPRKKKLGLLEPFRKKLPSVLKITPWVEKEEAIATMQRSHVLLLSSWEGTKGVYSGKLFEYLGARRPILLSPGNEDVADELIKKTNSGVVANTPEEVSTFISAKYAEWMQKGVVSYEGVEDEIEKYSRENQVKKMAELIKEHMHETSIDKT